MRVTCPSCQTQTELPPGGGGFCTRCGTALSAPAEAPRTSKLAIASLVCGLLFCLPLLNVVGAVAFGVAALIAISDSQGRLTGQAYAIAGMAVSVAMVPIIGIMAAIAIPNFIKFQQRSKVGEARATLKGLAASEKAYYAEYDTYVALGPVPDHLPRAPETLVPDEGGKKLGWQPPERARFQYRAEVEGSGPTARVRLIAVGSREALGGSEVRVECEVTPTSDCVLSQKP